MKWRKVSISISLLITSSLPLVVQDQCCKLHSIAFAIVFNVFFMTFFIPTVSTGDGASPLEESVR